MRAAILALLVACSTNATSTPPAQPVPTTPAPDPGPPAPVATDAAPAAGGTLHEPCGADDACAPGLECLSYYGIAGARGPQFKTCEIRCDAKTKCPAGTTCGVIADGPGQVCR